MRFFAYSQRVYVHLLHGAGEKGNKHAQIDGTIAKEEKSRE
jgi:hypothetical protein